MTQPLEKKINDWTRNKAFGLEIQEINGKLIHLDGELFKEYEPTRGPHPAFRDRLGKWLDNLSDESDQRSLFRFIPHIFFVGPRELEVLHRVAFHTQIARWLIDQTKLTFDTPDPETRLSEAVKQTWFCPITDSMRINAFYHLNHISGRDYRPDWRSLTRFGGETKIQSYLSSEAIQRIVLLEDFVGSGDQMEKAVVFAASFGLPVLVVPLVICPDGVYKGEELESKHANVTVSPIISLQKSLFVAPVPSLAEDPLFNEIRTIAGKMFAGLPANEQLGLYTPFGFADTGSLVVMYTNCPDNTLPLVHHSSPNWMPLFPRASRL